MQGAKILACISLSNAYSLQYLVKLFESCLVVNRDACTFGFSRFHLFIVVTITII